MKNPIQIVRKTLSIALLVCLCFIHTNAQNKNASAHNTLPVSTPEAEGVSSAGILKFLDAVENGKNELHSFVILRHGKIISQGWWSPYGKELKHVMFSVSKSFTSIGVGLAIAEHKLKLSDKVVSFFPHSLPDTLCRVILCRQGIPWHVAGLTTNAKPTLLLTACAIYSMGKRLTESCSEK